MSVKLVPGPLLASTTKVLASETGASRASAIVEKGFISASFRWGTRSSLLDAARGGSRRAEGTRARRSLRSAHGLEALRGRLRLRVPRRDRRQDAARDARVR